MCTKQVSSSSSSKEKEKEGRWNELPEIAVRKTFGELIGTIDRARMRLVCKSWRQILTRDDLPATKLPTPWKFLPKNSVFDPESNLLLEIQFKRFASNGDDLERYTVTFGGGCWLCGCSNGWLAIAAGSRLNPDMSLCNPLTKKTLRLPPLMSTLGLLESFHHTSKQYNISNYVKRIQVFSRKCIVAVVFADPLVGEDAGQEFLALSTPEDESWTVFRRDSRYLYLFHDILFHNDKLHVLVDQNWKDEEESHIYEVSLANCQVQVCLLHIHSKNGEHQKLRDEENVGSPVYNISYNDHVSLRLGEFCGQLLLSKAVYDRVTVNSARDCPVKALQCLQLSSFTLETVDGLQTRRPLENLGGNYNLLLADNGFFTVSKGLGGEDNADCIFYEITSDHAGGFVQGRGHCVARETSVFNIRTGDKGRNSVIYLSYDDPTRLRTYYLTPKLI